MTDHQPESIRVHDWLPVQVNQGRMLTAYTLPELVKKTETSEITLPICSLGTLPQELKQLGPLVLPPLYHEAIDGELKSALIARVHHCFPYLAGSERRRASRCQVNVIELPRTTDCMLAGRINNSQRIAVFSVDTAVEQHGPHLPLATDTIQSYAIIARLSREFPEVMMLPPVDYGQLTWGLPFGMSIDLTAPLVASYVTGYVNAILDWVKPKAVLVVDVHGSIIHRNAIQQGLSTSRCRLWQFRWLHEPLVPFAGERGDQHAGGVETAIIEAINPELLDDRFWPSQLNSLSDKQMMVAEAVSLSSNLDEFCRQVDQRKLNGVVGDIHNYTAVDGAIMLEQMYQYARTALLELL